MNDKRLGGLDPRARPMRPLVGPDGGGRARRCRAAARAHAPLGLPGPAARGGVRDLAAHDRRRPPDRARAGRLAGERGALARSSPGSSSAATSTSWPPPRPTSTEDLLEHARAPASTRSSPSTWTTSSCAGSGFYRFYDHVVAAADYDAMEDFTGEFFEHLASTWPAPTITGLRFMRELGRWLDAPGPRRLARGDVLPPRRAALRARRPRRPAGRGLPRRRRRRGPSWTSSPTTRSRSR